MEEYEDEFLSKEEGASRAAVKKLTKRLELQMMKQTINAGDWLVFRIPSVDVR